MPYGAFVGDLYGMAAGNNTAETLKNGMRIPDIKPQEDDEEKKARPSEAAAAPPSIAAGSKPYSGRRRSMPADDGKAGEIGRQMAEAAPSSDMEAAISSVSSQMAIWFGGRYAFNEREKETFATMVQGASDPVDTAGRYMAAVAISKRIGTTADRIYPNIDQISKYFTGNVYRAGDATLAEKVNASFESIEISDMKGEWMKIVRKNGFYDPKALALEAEIQQREEAIGGIQNAIPKGFWDGVANDIIGSLGYTMEGIKHGAAASTGVLAGTAPMIASIAALNPFTGAAITATAGLWAGFAGTVSGFNRTRELTEYDTFWDLMHQTDAEGNMLVRDVESASLIAGINGNITGFLESMADGIISRGINAFAPTVISRIGLPNLTVKVLTDGGVQGVRSRLAYAGVDWLLGGLNEGFVQEAPEQLATAVLTAAYRKTVGAEPDISLKQLASDFFSTGFRSTLVGLAYGGVGVPTSMRQYSQTAFDLRRMANATPSEEVYFSRTKDMKPEGVPQADFDTARSQIYSAAKAQREAVFGRREGTVMASEELAAEELYDTVNAETGEETGIMPDGAVYRDPETERLHSETRRENGRTRVYAGDRNTGAVYGYAEVTTDGDTLTVGSVRVRQGYEGIREELVREAISSQRTGESSIAWEPSTEGLQKVKELLVQNNPRGSEAGLDYGSDLSINQDHDIEALSSSIRTAMPALSREESIVAARLYSIADADGALSRLNEGQPVRISDTLPERYRGAADGARAIIYAGKNSDFSTFYHELFHVNAQQRPSEARGLSNAIRTSMQDDASKANLRKFIEESREIWGEGFNADDVMQHLETIPADSDASQWSRAQFEDLARLAEAYATADNSKRTTLPEAIRNILRKIGEYMRKVYQTVTHAVPLPKEITEAYDVLMYNARASENAEVSNGLQYQDGNKTSGWKISKSMELVREKYSAAIPDKEAWDNKLAEDFFGQYRSEIEGLINEYEKVEVDGILMLSGMPSSDNPFQKELVQARFLKEITGSDVILLPRYSKQLLNSIFGVNLGKSSFADGVALIPDDNRFIEFKLCNNKNAGGYIGKAKGKGADGILIAINNNPTNLSAESFYSYWQDRIAGKDLAEGMDVYIFDINNGYLFTKNKETSSGLLDSPKGRTFGPRTGDIASPTVLALYAQELREINRNDPEQPMDYSAYQQAELLHQDSHVPDTSDLTEVQKTKRNEAEEVDARYVDGDNTDLDSFYDDYDSSMDSIGTAYDAEEMSRIYSEWAVEVDEAAFDANASLVDEDAVPYYDENTVNLMPDGSAAASQAEYERAVNSEVIPSMAESDGVSMHGADDGDASASDPGIEPEPRHPGISYRDAYDEELSWNEFVDRNKPDIVYEGTDVEKDDRFIQAIQDDDTLLRYLGIIGEALYLNTRELNEDWHFGDQIQRERVKARVFDVITNTSIRNASLTAMKAGAGRTLSPRMYSLIRREMSSNARFYRNVLSWMMADDSMKPESLMKEPRGLDIPSRDALDAMPIQELRALAETAEDRDIVDQIERGTLRFEGGADETRGEEINAALESLAKQVTEQQEELSRNEDTIDALESDLNAVQTALDERDRHIDSLVSTLQKVETIVRTGTKELTGETLEAYSFTPAMKKISSELSWLNKGRYEGLEAEHTKGKHGKYEVPKARREAREEYISMLTSFYPGIFEAEGRGFGKLDGIRDIYSPSGFEKVQEVLEARREELRAEWKEAAAAYADDLSAATWAASRSLSDSIDSTLGRIGSLEKEIGRQKRLKDTVKANRDRQLYDKTTRERWMAAKRARAAERRYEERIHDARTEERWKAAKRFLEREKELNQQIQDWKSFAAWQKKDLSEKARESTADAVNDAVTRERWLSAKKLNERTAELQREIDDWKSYARWEKKDRKAERDSYIRKAKDDAALLADWMKAKADVRISELKAEQREKRRQERLYRRIREEKEKLGRVIARPVNLSTTDYETSAEAIMAIQALVDPHFRRDWTQDLENNLEGAAGGGTMTIPEAVAYLQNLQEDDRNNILSILSPELAARLSGVRNPLNDWTVEQLRQLAEQTEELRRRGREVMRAKKAFERETRERIQKAIINAVREAGKRKGEELPDTVPGTAERVRQSQGVLAKLRSAKYITMRMQELAQLLDGGLGHRGAAYQLLVDEKRYHQSREWQAVDARMGKVAPYLTRKAVNELFEKVTLHLDGGFSRAFTINELAYVYLSQFDEDSRAAVAYGNLLTDTEKGTLMNAGRLDENGKFIPNAMSDGTIVNDEELQAIGDRRYHEAARIATLELERRGLIPLVEAIKEDFAAPENFRRLNSASVEAYNTPMKKVQNYLPIMRQDLRGDNFRNDMADALFNLNTGDFNAALDKGMTISRIKIAPRHQRGVNLSLLEVWQKSVRNQEHLIEFAQYAKKVRGVFGSQATELVSMVDKVYSPGLMNEVQGYIDYVINPYSGQPRTNLDRTLRNLRGRTGAAYLGWKLPGVVLQFCTSAWPFLQDMSPAALLRGYLKLASGRGDAFNMIYEKSPMMKHRTMSTVVQEALERRGDANRSKAGRTMDRFNEVGQLGLTWVDKTLVAGGWLGTYETALQQNLEAGMDTALADAAAVKAADDVVLRTQPAGDSTELPSMFRNSNELVKIFLQFQSSLSVIWNNMVWDNIGFARNRQYGKIIASVVSYGMAGLMLGLVAEGFDDDDEAADRARKLGYWFMTQGIESFPVFGSDISLALQRIMTGERDFYGNGVDMFPGITKILSGIEDIVASDKPFTEGLRKVAEGTGIFAGAPVSGLKNLKRVAEEGPAALLGR